MASFIRPGHMGQIEERFMNPGLLQGRACLWCGNIR